MVHITFQQTLTYGFLSFALISLWLPIKTSISSPVKLWHVCFVVALGCGLLFGDVKLIGLLSIVFLGIACVCTASERYPKSVRILTGTVMFVLVVGLSLHVVPGFTNPKIIDNVIVSEGGIPYSKYLNFDKILVGLFVLGFTCNNLLSRPRAWRRMFKKVAPISGITIIVLLFMSFFLGYVRFEPKWSELFWFWAWANLFTTCISEEAIFRGIVQRYLIAGLMKYRYGKSIGLFLASIIFGLAHYPGGTKYVLLSTLAGLGYGWAYLRTKQIEASILTHFLVNCLHFVFFTYPALATAIK